MTDAPPRFSLVIATRGRPSVLAETLASAARCDPRPAEVIVVDGDRARSAEPAARAAGARYERSAPGLTTQRNAGLELAEGDVVVFVDDDTELHPGLFAALADAYRDTDVLGVTGPVVDRDLRRFGNMRSRWRRVLPGGGREGSLTRYGYPRRVQDETRERNVDADRKRDREFNRDVVVNRAYLFRKNFRRTPLARLQFGLLVGLLLVHRVVNGEWAGVRGLLEGSVEAWRARR